MIDLVITGGTLASAEGVERAALAIDGGKIVAVGADAHMPTATETLDASGMLVVPGAIDTHSHVAQSALMRQFEGAPRSPAVPRAPSITSSPRTPSTRSFRSTKPPSSATA
jgi:cytosine/adenosine deaminase-related metal-dependent hydrolase